MEKKIYEKPAMQMEEFIPNECVASCGQTVDGNYLFECDAANAQYGTLYEETNGLEGLQTRRTWVDDDYWGHWVEADREIGYGHACGFRHEAPSSTVFKRGYLVVNGNVIDVLTYMAGNTGHATENLNQEHYLEPKS